MPASAAQCPPLHPSARLWTAQPHLPQTLLHTQNSTAASRRALTRSPSICVVLLILERDPGVGGQGSRSSRTWQLLTEQAQVLRGTGPMGGAPGGRRCWDQQAGVTCTFISRSVSQIRIILTSPEVIRSPVSCSQSTTIPAPETQQGNQLSGPRVPDTVRGNANYTHRHPTHPPDGTESAAPGLQSKLPLPPWSERALREAKHGRSLWEGSTTSRNCWGCQGSAQCPAPQENIKC